MSRHGTQSVFEFGQQPGFAVEQEATDAAFGIAGIVGGTACLDIVGDEDRRIIGEDLAEGAGQLHGIQNQPVNRRQFGERGADPVRRHSMHLGDRNRFAMNQRVLEPERLAEPADTGIGDFEMTEQHRVFGIGGSTETECPRSLSASTMTRLAMS